MINVAEITSTKGMEQAQKQMEQAKNRVALEKKKANDESLLIKSQAQNEKYCRQILNIENRPSTQAVTS